MSEKKEAVLKIISYNIDGLPFPKALTSKGRDPKLATKYNIRHLNKLSPDILALQEDFGYHELLKEGLNFEYKTIHSGNIPFGDGLSIFSKFPIYNTKRVTWCDANGILRDASDELTPKGFLYSAIEVQPGIYIDIYDIHADANESDGDVSARINQFTQLLDYIEEHSADRPVIVLGDTNTRIGWENSKLRELFIEIGNFKDCWTECCLGGKYQKDMINLEEYKPYEPDKWDGVFDALDKVLFRDGKGFTFTAIHHKYLHLGTEDEKKNCVELSDHSAAIAYLKYSVDTDLLPNDTVTYETEKKPPFIKTHVKRTRNLFRTLGLIFSEVPSLLKGEKIEMK